MNKFFKKVATALVGCAMAIGVGVAVGSGAGVREAKAEDVSYTLTIATSDFTTTSYANNNGSHNKDAVCTTDNTKKMSVSWYSNQVYQNSSVMQWQKSNGYIYNTKDLGTITSVTVNSTAGSFTTYYGTSSHPTSGTTVGNGFFTVQTGSSETGKTSSIVIAFTISEGGGPTPTTYSVTYDANGGTGTVQTENNHESGDTFNVKGNTGNLTKLGYYFGGWNDGTTTYQPNAEYTMPANAVEFSAVWTSDTLNSLSISGSMSKTSYIGGASWSASGFTITANYQNEGAINVTSLVEWSYYVGGAVQSTAVVGDTSVVVRATYGGTYIESSAQTVSVVSGVTYDLTKIEGFSSWTNSYGAHDLTNTSFNPDVSYASTLNFLITNKQGSGVGSTYPCIGGKNDSETTCLTFSLTETGKKITYVEIVFVTRYTSTYPSLFLHKGNGIGTSAIDTLTMSGNGGTELSLEYDNLNDTVFTVGYLPNQTKDNGAVGIKSITIGVANQATFGNLDHIKVTGLPNTVYHIGESYDSTGFAVTAYDGAYESTANFKDVTASVTTSYDEDSEHVFDENDVPGVNVTVSYTGDNGSDSTSFHIDVYALAEYSLVTEAPANWSGNYLIVGTNDKSQLGAMNGGLANPDTEKGYKVVTDSEGIIQAGQELEWTISSITGGYSIQGKGGKYIGSLTTASNGMLVSNSPIVNTLSYDNGESIINGTNGYGLTLKTTGDRFRYYSGGTVQLYKLVESNKADEYAQEFLRILSSGEGHVCKYDSSTHTVSTDLDELKEAWANLATDYLNTEIVPLLDREQFRTGVASDDVNASNIAKALALYDHICRAYGESLESVNCDNYNFMNRSEAVSSGRISSMPNSENGSIVGIIVVSLTSLMAIGGYFFLKRKKHI